MANKFHSSKIRSVWEKFKSSVSGLWDFALKFTKLLLIPLGLALAISTVVLYFFEKNRIKWDIPAMIFVVFMVCWLGFPFHPSQEVIKNLIQACLGAPSKKSPDNTEDSSQSLKAPPEEETIIKEQHKTSNK